MVFKAFLNLFQSERDQSMYDIVARLNVESKGGSPVTESCEIGEIMLPSRSVMLDDPQYMPDGLVIASLAADKAQIEVNVLRYPDGGAIIKQLWLKFSDVDFESPYQQLGELGIDSAAVAIADTEDTRVHWTATGPDRIGVINVARDQKAHKLLKKKFKLKTRQVNRVRVEVQQPVSEALEQEIEDFLKTIPQYADYPFMHFYVQTNDSFDRVNYMNADWKFLPVGNQPDPVMFACSTGYGDGIYPVEGIMKNNLVHALKVTFIDEDDEL